jgi:hypothetical protein
MSTSPLDWEGGAIWDDIKTLSDNVVVPISALVFLIIMVNDLVQSLVSLNNYQDGTLDTFYKWFLKLIVGVLLISNVFTLATWLFQFGVYVGTEGLNQLLGTGPMEQMNIADLDYDIGELLLLLLLSILLIIAVIIIIVAIIITLVGRIIEAFMYIGIAPIPMATFMNKEWQSMGYNWVRGVAALAFQAFFIVVAMSIFARLFNNLVAIVNGTNIGDFQAVFFSFVILIAFAVALIFTILRSGSISKSIFGAH